MPYLCDLEEYGSQSEQRKSTNIDNDKPFAPNRQHKDEELIPDEDLDRWLKLEMEKRMSYTNENTQIKAPSHKTNEVQEVSFATEDEEGDISKALPCQLPSKELNPGSFTLPCTIASLLETSMVVEMADMMTRAPLGIVENILVKIDKFLFPFDLGIIDMLGKPDETIILGRPFLATIHAQINVFERENLVGIGEERVKFNMNEGISHSGIPVEKMCMASSVHEKEYFNSLETKKDVFSYESSACLLFEQLDFGKTRDDLFSRSFDEYKEVSDNEIEELTNEYDLRVERKRYALDDVWEKCEKFHHTAYLWHDEGFEEEEQWESGIENIDYKLPFVKNETFEVK
nr:hypothetical protein [Tanacetum cinerariifolium]